MYQALQEKRLKPVAYFVSYDFVCFDELFHKIVSGNKFTEFSFTKYRIFSGLDMFTKLKNYQIWQSHNKQSSLGPVICYLQINSLNQIFKMFNIFKHTKTKEITPINPVISSIFITVASNTCLLNRLYNPMHCLVKSNHHSGRTRPSSHKIIQTLTYSLCTSLYCLISLNMCFIKSFKI